MEKEMLRPITVFWRELTKPMPLEKNFANYDEYWNSRGFNAPSLNRARKIGKQIDKNSTILDIGCGDGTVMKYLKKHNKPKRVVGVDISKKAVSYVKKQGLEAKVMDVFSDNFHNLIKKEKFDYVIITEVLEHVQDPEMLISALHDQVGKSIFVSIPNAGFFVNRLRFMFGKFPLVMIQEHVKEHIRFWTKKDFYYWAEYHNYKVERAIVTAGMHIKPLEFLERLIPSLFANQIMYQIKPKK